MGSIPDDVRGSASTSIVAYGCGRKRAGDPVDNLWYPISNPVFWRWKASAFGPFGGFFILGQLRATTFFPTLRLIALLMLKLVDDRCDNHVIQPAQQSKQVLIEAAAQKLRGLGELARIPEDLRPEGLKASLLRTNAFLTARMPTRWHRHLRKTIREGLRLAMKGALALRVLVKRNTRL
jgi:hypothetical protein